MFAPLQVIPMSLPSRFYRFSYILFSVCAALTVAPPALATPSPAVRCSTPALLHALRDPTLPPKLQAQLTQLRLHRLLPATPATEETPVPTVGSVASTRYPLRVHYRLESQRTLAEQVLQWAELSWEVQIESLGFTPPLPDNAQGGDDHLDLYLATSARTSGGALTIPTYEDADPSDGKQACATYILLCETLDPEVLPVYVAHELNHAMQAAMDFRELIWGWEVTATFLEDLVFDSINDYDRYIPYFQQLPEQHLLYFSREGTDAYYPYGASIFLHFLREATFGGDASFSADLWKYAQQDAINNEPDFLDAIESVTQAHSGTDLTQLYADFALWRASTGSYSDGAHFSEGADWQDSEVLVRFEATPDQLPAEGTFPEIYELGTGYLKLTAGVDPLPTAVRITLLGADPQQRLGIAAQRRFADGHSEDLPLILAPTTDEAEAGSLETTIELKGATTLTVAVLNLGRMGRDGDDGALETEVHLRMDAAGGCGCAQAEGSSAPTGGLLLLALGLLKRLKARGSRLLR